MKQSINASGVNHDIAPAELPPDVWNDLQNVTFNNGYAQSVPGYAPVMAGALCRPLYALPLYTETTFYWIYTGNNDGETAGVIAVTDGQTHWDITPAAWSVMAAGDITGGVLNGIPFLNNGIDPPVWWDVVTANVCTILPGWPVGQLCKALRPFKYHLIAMNIESAGGTFPELVVWSSAANPGAIPDSWTPDPANEAGSFTISATTGGIVDGGQMRDQFMVYKTHSSAIMQYIAGQFIFSNRKAFVTSGILARNCWQEMYGQHYVITDGDFIQHNGQEVKSLIDGSNREWFFSQIDPTNYKGSYLAASHDHKQLWLCIPKTGNTFANLALVFDIKSGSFGDSDLNNAAFIARGIIPGDGAARIWDTAAGSWDEQTTRWNQQLFNPTTDAQLICDYENTKFHVQEGFTYDGAPIPILLQMLSKDFGEPQRRKLILAVWVLSNAIQAPGSGGVAVRIGTQELIADPIKWSAATPIVNGKADFMESGRYISLEITANQLNAWRLNSLDADYNLQGAW